MHINKDIFHCVLIWLTCELVWFVISQVSCAQYSSSEVPHISNVTCVFLHFLSCKDTSVSSAFSTFPRVPEDLHSTLHDPANTRHFWLNITKMQLWDLVLNFSFYVIHKTVHFYMFDFSPSKFTILSTYKHGLFYNQCLSKKNICNLTIK